MGPATAFLGAIVTNYRREILQIPFAFSHQYLLNIVLANLPSFYVILEQLWHLWPDLTYQRSETRSVTSESVSQTDIGSLCILAGAYDNLVNTKMSKSISEPESEWVFWVHFPLQNKNQIWTFEWNVALPKDRGAIWGLDNKKTIKANKKNHNSENNSEYLADFLANAL